MNDKTFAFGIILCLAAVLAQSAVQVELSARPPNMPPGLSVYLCAEVTSGDAPVSLSRLVRVRVTPPNGETFIATWGDLKDSDSFDVADDSDLVVPAHSRGELCVAPRAFGRPSWAFDERMATPGRYQLEMLTYGTSDLTMPIAVSQPVPLQIVRADQRDSDIFAAAVSGRLDDSFAEKVLEHAPESPYVPYLYGRFHGRSRAEQIELFRQIIKQHSQSPMVGQIQLWVAQLYDSESHDAFWINHDIDRAVLFADREREILTSLANGTEGWARRRASQRLENGLPSRSSYLELSRRNGQ